MTDPNLARYDPAYGKRAEFVALVRDEGRRLNTREMDLLDGAMNLLDKALRRQDDGEDEKADRLISRAAAMHWDDRMEGSPGVRGANQLLHDVLSDWFEESDVDDLWWLDVAIAAHDRLSPGPGRDEIASVVHGFVLQAGVYDTTRSEQDRIRAAFGDAPLEADLGDRADQTPAGRESIIRSLLVAIRELQDEAQRTG